MRDLKNDPGESTSAASSAEERTKRDSQHTNSPTAQQDAIKANATANKNSPDDSSSSSSSSNDHHSELDSFENALTELQDVMNGVPTQSSSAAAAADDDDEDSLRGSLHDDLKRHEEAIEALQRELAQAETRHEGSSSSQGSHNRGSPLYHDQHERSFTSLLSTSQHGNNSCSDERSSLASRTMVLEDTRFHSSDRSMGSSSIVSKFREKNQKRNMEGGEGNTSSSIRSMILQSHQGSSTRSSAAVDPLLGNQNHVSDRSIVQPLVEEVDGGDHSEACLDKSETPSALERRNSRPLLQELRRVPSERFWVEPFDVKKPKSVLRRIRLLSGKVVEHPTVQILIIWLIVINAVMMGIGTFDFVTDSPQVEQAFQAVDESFLIVFTVELVMQLLFRGISLFTDGWLVFDFVIVVISWSLESLQVIRAFRIFRAFRLVTRLGTLRELIMAIGNVMPRIYAIAMLLLLIFYIFGVLFTELFSDLVYEDYDYFSRLDASLFTCMELMTLEWANIARQTMAQKTWAWIPFLSFISVTGFIVFNLIVAVVCDAVKVTDRQVKREKDIKLNGHDKPDTDASKLHEAQERIWELTDHIEMMELHHKELQNVVAMLASELATELGLSSRTPHQSTHGQPESTTLPHDDDHAVDDVHDSRRSGSDGGGRAIS